MQITPICCELLQGEETVHCCYSTLNFLTCMLKLELAGAAALAMKQAMLAGIRVGSALLQEASLGRPYPN